MHVATYAIVWFLFVLVIGMFLMLVCTFFACLLKNARAWWVSRRLEGVAPEVPVETRAAVELPPVKWFVVANPDDELMVGEPA